MAEKQEFIERMKTKTKDLAVEVISFCSSLKSNRASSVISYQLIKTATSAGANYRAACKARSRREFLSKLSIVVEEADEITKIMSSARKSVYLSEIKLIVAL